MDRRSFLGAGASAALVAMADKADALGTCQPFAPGVNICQVGLASSLVLESAKTQNREMWCWAASISMIFAYYGHDVDQQDIVSGAWGGPVNMPGQPQQIVQSINRSWDDQSGGQFNVTGDVMSANIVTAAQDLDQDHPLLVGTLGHCMVMTGLEYFLDAYGHWRINLASVSDPWPYNPRERNLSPQEWAGISFLARIRVY